MSRPFEKFVKEAEEDWEGMELFMPEHFIRIASLLPHMEELQGLLDELSNGSLNSSGIHGESLRIFTKNLNNCRDHLRPLLTKLKRLDKPLYESHTARKNRRRCCAKYHLRKQNGSERPSGA